MPKQKILIVEDNSDVRRLYAIGLNRHGFEVKLAANGAEAIDRIENERPDLILLDVVMPVMSGWEVLAMAHPESYEPPIPVVVVSGQPQEPGTAYPAPVVAWLSKPVTIEELVSTIHQHLGRDHSRASDSEASSPLR
jgi:CheY-like chemotaxis protein